MEFKADALVLRAADWGEYDKIVTLFTAERGKLSAALKGVKRAGAKLRFAAQPFCFAEFVFAEKSGRNTVISASVHDGFYALREDIACYYAAVCVAEACDKLLFEGMVSPALFLAAVRALGALSACAEGGARGGGEDRGRQERKFLRPAAISSDGAQRGGLSRFGGATVRTAANPSRDGCASTWRAAPSAARRAAEACLQARAPTSRSARRSDRGGRGDGGRRQARPCASFPPIFPFRRLNCPPLPSTSDCKRRIREERKHKKSAPI